MKKTALLFLFFYTVLLTAQNRKLDSLIRNYASLHDTDKVRLLVGLSNRQVGNDPNAALKLTDSALVISKRINYKLGIGSCYSSLGSCYVGMGKFDLSLNYLHKAVRVFESIHSRRDIVNTYNSIGNTFTAISRDKEALDYYSKAYALAKTPPVNEYMVAITSVGVGNMLVKEKKHKEAITYYKHTYDYFEKQKSPQQQALCMIMIGQALYDSGNYSEAEKMFKDALPIQKELNDLYGLASNYSSLGDVEKARYEFKKAAFYYKEALEISIQRKSWPDIKSNSRRLSEVLESANEPAEALKNYKIYLQYNDSILNVEKSKAIAESESKYQSEKKEQEIKLKNAELEKSNLKVSQRNNLIYIFAIASVIFVVLLFFVFRQYREKRNANILLVNKNDEIEKQKSLIEEKNKDITDSINYSKHIQRAILPSDKYIKFHLPESFIIYKPKDIVSGDFYLVEEIVGLVYIAVVDCTGHGVPGAMLSVFANATIKNTIASNAFRDNPAAILSDLCYQFKSNLLAVDSNMSINDGVDMSICILDKNQKKIYFAGARNGLLAVSEGELKEYKANRWGISGTNSGEQLFFTNYEIDYKKGDRFYLSTDGFYDQFGGPEGKKLKHKMLKEMILKVHSHSFDAQAEELTNEFMNWKGRLEQLDDVTLIGFGV